ncbi:MAG: peptidylprolyl isomerase [candidate division WOR-3 bacterium]|jgi:peptidyl-prolyl cis-trans isomerase SurA|nr:peptidylprolyl isomerase [candidate division WOR-3 bacterium]MCR4423958.1 peptidylprolyl isomerase [candidate division WOR-3 bacterium]MDH7519623.1 peptidylprolyl isomerase [bacterium]
MFLSRRWLAFLALFLLSLFNGVALAGSADSIAAVVGNKIILESEVQQLMTYLRLMSGDTITDDSLLRTSVLRRLLDEALLSEQAEQESIDVTREEIAAGVTENLNSLKERFATEAEFRQTLAAEGLTEKQLRDRISKEVRRNLLARKLLEKEGLTQIYISPAEAEQFYNTHKDSIARVPGRVELSHILIALKPSDSAEASAAQRAQDVLNLIARGGDFATLARSFSEDKKTVARGGDWGWQDTNAIPWEFKLVLNQLQYGQVSPPFRIRSGYCIVQLTERSKNRLRFRSILIAVPITRADTLRALSTARKIKNMLKQGVPFESLARRYSDDPETAKEGGYLGTFYLDGLMPPFDQVITQLDSGAVSEPVLSEHGFHIIKLLNKEPTRTLSFLEIQDAIRNYLYEQRFAERLRQYLDRVERNIYVEVKGTRRQVNAP